MNKRKILPGLSCDASKGGVLKADKDFLYRLINDPPLPYHKLYLKVTRIKTDEKGRPKRRGGEFETETFDDGILSFELGYIVTEKEGEA